MVAHHHGTVPGLAAPELAHHRADGVAPLGTAAARAVVTPTSETAPDAANVEGRVQTETQCLIFEQPNDNSKRFKTLQAHFALNGWIVTHESGGVINATRWGHTRSFDTLQELHAFAIQVRALP